MCLQSEQSRVLGRPPANVIKVKKKKLSHLFFKGNVTSCGFLYIYYKNQQVPRKSMQSHNVSSYIQKTANQKLIDEASSSSFLNT